MGGLGQEPALFLQRGKESYGAWGPFRKTRDRRPNYMAFSAQGQVGAGRSEFGNLLRVRLVLRPGAYCVPEVRLLNVLFKFILLSESIFDTNLIITGTGKILVNVWSDSDADVHSKAPFSVKFALYFISFSPICRSATTAVLGILLIMWLTIDPITWY